MKRKTLNYFSLLAVMTLCFACTNEVSDEQADTPSFECSGSDCNDTAPDDNTDVHSEDDSQTEDDLPGLCGNKECAEDETCENNKCVKLNLCADIVCDPGEHCDEGICILDALTIDEKCVDVECEANEECQDGKCILMVETCGDTVCDNGFVCENNECICDSEDCAQDGVDEPPEDIESVEPENVQINVEPESGLVINRSGKPVTFIVSIDSKPKNPISIPVKLGNTKWATVSPEKLIFDQGNYNSEQIVTISPTDAATKTEQTFDVQVGPATGDMLYSALDAIKIGVKYVDSSSAVCDGKLVKAESGECVHNVSKISLKSSYKILLGKSVTIKADVTPSTATNNDLIWNFKYSDDDYVNQQKNDPNNKDNFSCTKVNCRNVTAGTTDTSYIVGNTFKEGKQAYARTLTLTVSAKSDPNVKATTTIYLKPYLPVDRDNTYKYRNFRSANWTVYCDKKNDKGEDYNEGKNKEECLKDKKTADENNRGFGDIQCKAFDPATIHTLNHDLYYDYVLPKMIVSKNGNYYGTRASVVAALRFLTVQFPYDIPYHSSSGSWTTQSHYVWSSFKRKPQKCEARILGLNLSKYAYNNANDDTRNADGSYKYTSCKNSNNEIVTYVKDNVVPWGCPISWDTKDGDKKIKMTKPNGMECSGLVTWALQNGRVNVGDAKSLFSKTEMFCSTANDVKGDCVKSLAKEDFKYSETETYEVNLYKDTELYNYHNPYFLLQEFMEIIDKNGNPTTKRASNENNIYDKISELKFKKFNASKSIIPLYTVKSAKENKDFKKSDIKAGDLLNRPKILSDGTITSTGHIAMILAVTDKYIYVGEASQSGNRVSRYETVEKLINSWSQTHKADVNYIKLDALYSYYGEVTLKDGTKANGNDYNFCNKWSCN